MYCPQYNFRAACSIESRHYGESIMVGLVKFTIKLMDNVTIMICITRYMSVCFYIDSRIGASSPLSERRRDLQVPPQVDGVALPSEP